MSDPNTTRQAGGQTGGLSAVTGAAILGGLLVASALAFVTLRGGPEEGAAPEAPADVAPYGAVTADVAETAASSDPVETAADVTPQAPRFDLVRVDPTGGAVIAGQAVPGAAVTLSLDGAAVETVMADASGHFAAVLALPPSDQPRILGLQSVLPDGVDLSSAETVIIAPFAGQASAAATPPDPPPATRTDPPGLGEVTGTVPVLDSAPADATPLTGPAADLALAAPDSGPSPETRAPADPVTTQAPVAAEAPAVAAAPPAVPSDAAPPPSAPAPAAPTVLLADGDGVRVLQGPGGAPEAMTELRLDAITYDTAGEVTLAGRAPAEGSVRATLNNQPINLGEVGPGGQWSLDLPDVDPGTYTLRLEQLASDGRVTGRIETPFLREDPDRIQRNPMLVDPGASVITVQRGFTLWGIAEANFGDGIRYVQIFEENRDRIRDPDLIFPGQIFALPDMPRAAE
jgi:nucleoid-associated protein YgaU